MRRVAAAGVVLALWFVWVPFVAAGDEGIDSARGTASVKFVIRKRADPNGRSETDQITLVRREGKWLVDKH